MQTIESTTTDTNNMLLPAVNGGLPREYYWQPPGTDVTVCLLVFENGDYVIGHTFGASLRDKQVAFNQAIDQYCAPLKALFQTH